MSTRINLINFYKKNKEKTILKPYIHYTFVPATMSVVLHLLADVELERELEFLIWQRCSNLPIRNTNIFGLSTIAESYGLNPYVLTETEEFDYPEYRFKGYTKKDIRKSKIMNDVMIKVAKDRGINIKKREIPFHYFSRIVKKHAVLARLNIKYLDWLDYNQSTILLLTMDEDEDFIVYHPANGSFEKIDKKMVKDAYNNLSEAKRPHQVLVLRNDRKKDKVDLPDPSLEITKKDEKFFKDYFTKTN